MSPKVCVWLYICCCLWISVKSRGHGRGHGFGHSRGHGFGHSSGHWFGHSSHSSNHGYGHTSNTYHNTHSSGGSSYHPSHSSGSHSYGSGHGTVYHRPTYYTAPHYMYVQTYRNSESRYGDLLTGLALHNLGRSHSHYHHYYYNDDYYRKRYNTPSTSSDKPYDTPTDYAECFLKVKENGKEETLKVPCEIVSTFTEGSTKKVNVKKVEYPKPECKTIYPTTTPEITTTSTTTSTTTTTTTTTTPRSLLSEGTYNSFILDERLRRLIEKINNNEILYDLNLNLFEDSSNPRPPPPPATTPRPTTPTPMVICSTPTPTPPTGIDPLEVKGENLNLSTTECSVEIHINMEILRNPVDCKLLADYAKMPEPNKDIEVPERSTLKKWIERPPWWLSLFVAV